VSSEIAEAGSTTNRPAKTFPQYRRETRSFLIQRPQQPNEVFGRRRIAIGKRLEALALSIRLLDSRLEKTPGNDPGNPAWCLLTPPGARAKDKRQHTLAPGDASVVNTPYSNLGDQPLFRVLCLFTARVNRNLYWKPGGLKALAPPGKAGSWQVLYFDPTL
jgi:hypothetical protein